MSTPRKMLAVRLSPDGIAEVDRLANAAEVSRSDWLRAAIGAALADPKRVGRYLPKRGSR